MTRPTRDHDWIMAETERLKALGETEPRFARDPVNQPMINNWLEAIGETDARFTRGEAPPAMAQVWTMYGLNPTRPEGDPLHGTMQMLDAAGFPSVLGTNCDQTYERYLREGERVAITTRLESVVGPKNTGVGEGYFVTTLNRWWVGADPDAGDRELVATMLFRVLKFKPNPVVESPETVVDETMVEERGTSVSKPPDERGFETLADAHSSTIVADPRSSTTVGPDRSQIPRPVRNRDSEFFWEGTAAGELRIQKCNACGELRHPPGPMCPACHAMDRGYVVASGRGTIFSFLVHHAPMMPGRELPLTLALVELVEGVRMVATVTGAPRGLAIGDRVVAGYYRLDDVTLPTWEVVR